MMIMKMTRRCEVMMEWLNDDGDDDDDDGDDDDGDDDERSHVSLAHSSLLCGS